jgi:phosphatidylinositol dimannoside acyltransferase
VPHGPERYRGSGRAGVPVDRNPGAAARIPRERPDTTLQRLTGVLWQVAWEAVRRMPERAAFAIAALAAPVMRFVARTQRPRLRRNLQRVVPEASSEELDEMVAAGFRSYARYFIEAFRAADLSEAAVRDRVSTDGFHHLDAALERGKGVVVLLAHHGSWDVAARWAECHGYHLAVVAEVVKPRTLFEKFVRLREVIGLEVVPLRRGDDVKSRLVEVLAENHLVGLLSDRDLSGKGPVVDLFGEPSRVPPGPVQLARRTGAALVPISMLQRLRRQWHLQVLPEVDVHSGDEADAFRAMGRALEDIIRLDPTQWHALSPVWLADVPAHRRGDLPPEVAARLSDAEAS